MGDRDELLTLLCNRLLEATASQVRLTNAIERQQLGIERIARASEDASHHLDTNIPAIMQALGVVREQTGSFAKQEDTPTAIKIWDRFAAAPARLQWLIGALIVLATVSGWAKTIFEWAVGK